jgi:hypothetical protein
MRVEDAIERLENHVECCVACRATLNRDTEFLMLARGSFTLACHDAAIIPPMIANNITVERLWGSVRALVIRAVDTTPGSSHRVGETLVCQVDVVASHVQIVPIGNILHATFGIDGIPAVYRTQTIGPCRLAFVPGTLPG